MNFPVFPVTDIELHLCAGLVTQSCPPLCDPMDCGPPGFSVHGIFQARILGLVAISSFRGPSPPGDQTRVSCGSCIGQQILYHWATWEASQLRLVMVIEDTLKNIYLKNLLRLIHGQIDGIFLSFLFLFLRLNKFHCPIAVLTSAWSNLPLNSFSEIFISVFHFSASEFLLHVPFIDIFIFFTFSAFSFSDLSILKTVLFKSLPGISAIRSFPASFCWFTFFFWMGHTFIFLCMSRDFCCCWELDIWI